MHEPIHPWTDGTLTQQHTSPPVSNIPRWTNLTAEYQDTAIPIAEATELRKDLWLTSLNCGNLSEVNSQTQINKAKLSSICWQFQRRGSDVMYLTDTRLTQGQGQRALDFMRTLLPHGTFLRQSAVGKYIDPKGTTGKKHWRKGTPAPTGGGREPSPLNATSRIGGMILIVSNKWSKHIKDWWKDPSGSGVVSSVTIKAMSQDITIFGTYWPFMRVGAQTSEASGSLWNQLLDQYLQPNGLQENPREYVEGQISQQMVRRLGKERNTCALIGDFNGRLTQQEPGAEPVIMDLMCGKGWLPFLHTAPRGTNIYPIRTF